MHRGAGGLARFAAEPQRLGQVLQEVIVFFLQGRRAGAIVERFRFPQILLQPINFERLYQQSAQQQNAAPQGEA